MASVSDVAASPFVAPASIEVALPKPPKPGGVEPAGAVGVGTSPTVVGTVAPLRTIMSSGMALSISSRVHSRVASAVPLGGSGEDLTPFCAETSATPTSRTNERAAVSVSSRDNLLNILTSCQG
jgi:hypothetical protein